MMTSSDDPILNMVTGLLRKQRWAALASIRNGVPLASQVAFTCEPDLDTCLLHLSGLAMHTRNLIANPNVSLSISADDDGREDPQTLPRISLQGEVTPIARNAPDWFEAQQRYLARFPAAAITFGFADFTLFRMQISSARYVGGFADAHTFTAAALHAASKVRP